MEQTLRDRLAGLSPVEKSEAIQVLIGDLGARWPGIERHTDVCGGDACIVRTRIPVWVVEQMRRLGATEAELLLDYPTLNRDDLRNAWGYANANLEEINEAIADNEAVELEVN